MNANQTDTRFRQLYHEWRDQDAPAAPSFVRLTQPLAPERAGRTPWLLLAAAAASLVVVAGVLRLNHARAHRLAFDSRQWAALSNWQASTEVLLNPADSSVASPTPDTNATNQQETP